MNNNDASCYLVVRLRGTSGLSFEINSTLNMLNLKRANWATLVPNESSMIGMLRKVEKYITWGEPDEQLLIRLVTQRGELQPGVNADKVLKEIGLSTIDELIKKILNGELGVNVLWRIYKPYFRLHPPRRGFRHKTKRPYKEAGEYGYRGKGISELVNRMI